MFARMLLAGLAGVLILGGCGKKEVITEPASTQAGVARADVPRGWGVHESTRAGFSLALPPDWQAEQEGAASRIRAPGGALVATIVADRSGDGRTVSPADYALATLEALPGYRELEGRIAEAPESPYEAAEATGTGTRAKGARRQRITVTALRIPGRATFTAVAFSQPGATTARRRLERALTTLRALPPQL